MCGRAGDGHHTIALLANTHFPVLLAYAPLQRAHANVINVTRRATGTQFSSIREKNYKLTNWLPGPRIAKKVDKEGKR